MDRQIVYAGAIPVETDILNSNKYAMVGLSKIAAAILGTSTFMNGLACTATSPASLQVNVAPGEIYSLQNVDSTAYSSIAADTTHQILKQGISLDTVTLSCPAPGTSGQSINYLVQVAYQDVDSGSTTLPYYNSSNPSQAWSGPNNSGTPQNTVRKGVCTVAVKAGAAATTGTQTTPSPDSGYIGAYVVTVANGQSTITSGNISVYSGAPFLPASGFVSGAFQNNYFNASAAGGTADAITGSFVPQITALPTSGNGVLTVYVRAASANATTTPTFTPNSGTIAAKTIVKGAGSALVPGDIAGAGHWIELQYDPTLDKWVLLNPAKGISVSSTFTEVSISANTALGASNSGINYTATAALTLTIAQTTGLTTAWTNTVFALGGNVTLSINSADKINGGTAGAGIVIPVGYFATITTDANSNLYVEMGLAILAYNSIASAATTDISTLKSASGTITGTATITSFGSNAQPGQQWTARAGGAFTLTNNANIIVQGGANYTCAAGDILTILCTASNTFAVSIQQTNGAPQIQSVSASVASNALTLNYAGGRLDFRNATQSSGAPVSGVAVSANSITVPSGATLGTVSGQQARIVLLEAYNGGSPVLCVVNLTGGVQLDETNLISPTTISSGATANNVIYSASAVSANSPYRIVGFVDVTETTAGAWATAPTVVQGTGGQALAALSSLGYGQTWQNVTASRALSTTYYNTTGKPISVNAQNGGSATAASITATVNGVAISGGVYNGSGGGCGMSFNVSPGASYSIAGAGGLSSWCELR